MKIYVFFSVLFLLLSCSFTEPSLLIVFNRSEYEISAEVGNDDIIKENIDKNKGEIFYVTPGTISLRILIKEINFNKCYEINISHMGKKKFEFDLK